MRNALRMTVLFGAVASTGLAQTDFHCKLEGSSLIGHRDGVTEYEVDFQDAWSSKPVTVSAHAFVPDSDKPVAALCFQYANCIETLKGILRLRK